MGKFLSKKRKQLQANRIGRNRIARKPRKSEFMAALRARGINVAEAASASPADSKPAGESKGSPFGNSSASQATPNSGYEAAAMQAIGPIIGQVQRLMTMVGAASPLGKQLLDVLNKLVKIVPAGTTTPAAEKEMISQMAMRQTQNQAAQGQLQAQRQQMSAPGGASPAAGAPPGGAPKPMPPQAMRAA
jgi:hypothetical protein